MDGKNPVYSNNSKPRSQEGHDVPAMISIKEYAQRFSWSEVTVRRRIKDGTLPAVQLGGAKKSWRIPVNETAILAASKATGTGPRSMSESNHSKPSESLQSRKPHWLKK